MVVWPVARPLSRLCSKPGSERYRYVARAGRPTQGHTVLRSQREREKLQADKQAGMLAIDLRAMIKAGSPRGMSCAGAFKVVDLRAPCKSMESIVIGYANKTGSLTSPTPRLRSFDILLNQGSSKSGIVWEKHYDHDAVVLRTQRKGAH